MSLASGRGVPEFLPLAQQAPSWAWALVLAVGSPWLRVEVGPATLYPGHLLAAGLLAASLALHGFFRAAAAGGTPVPLLPAVAALAYAALVCAVRLQGWGLGIALGAGLANLAWGWAAYALGRSGRAVPAFAEGALLYLVLSLAVAIGQWCAQAWWPAACVALNCNPATAVPFPFTGGWNSNGQFFLLLVLLLPLAGEALLTAWRSRHPGWQGWVLLAVAAAAGVGALAGARWWGLVIVAAGIVLLWQVLLLDWRASDRLLMRGLVFFVLLGAITLYGMVPGYLPGVLSAEGRARTLAISLADPVEGGPGALSSERDVPLSVRVLNSGSYPLSASVDAPVRIKALLLYTPRSGGQTRASPGGEAALSVPLAAGESTVLAVPLRVPPWVNQGFLVWSAEDGAGQPLTVVEGASRGFRFTNAEYSALANPAENTLTALARRGRDYGARTLAPPSARVARFVESSVSDALDALFFSPIWGQPPKGATALPLETRSALAVQMMSRYGLLGLALLAWFWLDVFRSSYHVAYSRRAGAARMAWRLVPVSVLLLVLLSLISGETASYHSLWGCFLLSGFVQGVHDRVFPPRPAGLAIRLPRLAIRLPRLAFRLPWLGRRRSPSPRTFHR